MQPAVVVVDDEPPIVEIVCEALEEAGISTAGCTQAAEAFWFVQRYQPKLVILDVQMPGVDGLELLHHLRADPTTAALPVIFFTANSHVVRQRLPDYEALGATLLPKPFNIDQLLDLVRHTIASSKAADSSDNPPL